MKARTIRLAAAAAMAFLLAGAFVGVTGSAANAATSCYGGAITLNLSAAYQVTGPYYTTSRCNDINVRFTTIPSWRVATVCWSNHGTCESSWWFDAGDTSWKTIATAVKDNTKFTITWSAGSGSYTAKAAY